MSTEPKDLVKHDPEEDVPTRAENIVVAAKSVWAIVVAVVAVGGFVLRLSFQVDSLQESQRSSTLEFKQAVGAINGKLTELDRVAKLESRLESLKENGSDNLKAVRDELSRLRHDFDVHVAETKTITK